MIATEFSVMSTASMLPEPLFTDDRGIPPIHVRLNDSIETIIANNPALKIERTADGEIVFMSPTGGSSGIRNSELNLQLALWARSNGGVVFASTTLFRLPNGALRSPDASWIQMVRWQALTTDQQEEFPPIAPDFVIELRSRTDRLIDQQEKMQEYVSCGVRLGWLIDPLLQQVQIYKPDEPAVVLSNPRSVSDQSVLPGFVLDLNGIFVP
jgi:Uma2 family endonuclease